MSSVCCFHDGASYCEQTSHPFGMSHGRLHHVKEWLFFNEGQGTSTTNHAQQGAVATRITARLATYFPETMTVPNLEANIRNDSRALKGNEIQQSTEHD